MSSSSFTNPQKFTSTSIRFEKAASFQSSDNTNFIIAPRAHHTSTIVGSFMYIIGGTMGKSFFSDVRVIDLRGRDRDWSIPTLVTSMGTGDFQDVPMRGEITKPFEGRSRHTAVTVKNQKGNAKGETSIYVYGGVHGKDGKEQGCTKYLRAIVYWPATTCTTTGVGPSSHSICFVCSQLALVYCFQKKYQTHT